VFFKYLDLLISSPRMLMAVSCLKINRTYTLSFILLLFLDKNVLEELILFALPHPALPEHPGWPVVCFFNT